eukprot:NODE_4755_length_765_cov_62.832402_g4408_i0.p1 GENE.NODE_4755_length_765_cov_62.832402_g4408_i0~~NODE_4755_length_765_cov_62.832402_g4408_i0.p1  ORF type:complete len:150 (+),score=42.42 NODE_4755_length_765_cov_62.832402_g4408_i0:174-623(+)
MADITLVSDVFEVKELDPEGRKFDLVSRVGMHSEQHELDCMMDFNIDVFPVEHNCKLSIAWARTIDLSGKPSPDSFDKALCFGKVPSLMDQFEYVTYGRVYKVDNLQQQGKAVVYISYGGLLQKLVGEMNDLKEFEPDAMVYCLVKKVH